MESKKHTDAKKIKNKTKQEIKNLLSKGSIYKQMIEGERINPEMSKRETTT